MSATELLIRMVLMILACVVFVYGVLFMNYWCMLIALGLILMLKPDEIK